MKTLKKFLMISLVMILLFSFTGCQKVLMSAQDRGTYNTTVEKGEKIVKEYVRENMQDYRMGETICVQEEPAGGMYGDPTVYSSTKCINKKDNSTINILCNTETGELFSDKYVKKVERELIKYFENVVGCEKYKKKFTIFPNNECSWLDYGSVLMIGDTSLEDVLNNEEYSLSLRMYFLGADVEKIHSIPDSFVEECKINDLDISIVTTTDEEYYDKCLYSYSIWDPYDGGKNISRTVEDGEVIAESKNFFENSEAQ